MNKTIEKYREELKQAGFEICGGSVFLAESDPIKLDGDSGDQCIKPSLRLSLCYSEELTPSQIKESLNSHRELKEGEKQLFRSFIDTLMDGTVQELHFGLCRKELELPCLHDDFMGMSRFVYAKSGDFITKVTDGLLKRWGISSFEELISTVHVEQDWVTMPIEDVIKEMISEPILPANMGLMLVITNSEKCRGAAVLLDKEYLAKLWGLYGDSFIIPSSIHEVLLLPAKNFQKDVDADYNGFVAAINSYIHDINDAEVKYDEVLSQQLFKLTEKGLEVA